MQLDVVEHGIKRTNVENDGVPKNVDEMWRIMGALRESDGLKTHHDTIMIPNDLIPRLFHRAYSQFLHSTSQNFP